MVRHSYRKRRRAESHSFFGLRVEVLFRGYSVRDMLRIESEFREFVRIQKEKSLKSGELREVIMHDLTVKPFWDEV